MAKNVDSTIHAGYGVLGVAITAGFASFMGDGWTPTVLGAAASAGAILGCDTGLDKARRRFASVRQAIDDRSFLEGAWVQLDVRASDSARESENRFAIFVLTFDPTIDTYTVDGTAYLKDGREVAHWSSPDGFGLQVSANRRSANYDFVGYRSGNGRQGMGDRQGNTNLKFTGRERETGYGSVVHVELSDKLKFKLQKVTKRWLEGLDESALEPESLADPTNRDQFARRHAEVLGRRFD